MELCFRVKDDNILHTTALEVPDFGSVKFIFSISSMNHLNSMIDMSSRQISIYKKSFVFKSCFHNRVKAHNTLTIGIMPLSHWVATGRDSANRQSQMIAGSCNITAFG